MSNVHFYIIPFLMFCQHLCREPALVPYSGLTYAGSAVAAVVLGGSVLMRPWTRLPLLFNYISEHVSGSVGIWGKWDTLLAIHASTVFHNGVAQNTPAGKRGMRATLKQDN